MLNSQRAGSEEKSVTATQPDVTNSLKNAPSGAFSGIGTFSACINDAGCRSVSQASPLPE